MEVVNEAIAKGLNVGEEVVTTNAFALKAEYEK